MEHNNKNRNLNLATWNLCLGLPKKRDIVSQMLRDQLIDICVLQEIDILPGYDIKLIAFKGFNIEIENNNFKARTGIYLRNGLDYSRKTELEGVNSGLVIVDVKLKSLVRIIGVYRVFSPPGEVSQHAFFTAQIQLIKQACDQARNMKIGVLGDFNLNEDKKFCDEYSLKGFYNELNNVFSYHMIDDYDTNLTHMTIIFQ